MVLASPVAVWGAPETDPAPAAQSAPAEQAGATPAEEVEPSGATAAVDDADLTEDVPAEDGGEQESTKKDSEGPGEGDRDYGHQGQFSLRASLVGGYRMVFRYPESPYCADPNSWEGEDPPKLCGFAAPLAVQLALGFAPLDAVEPFVYGRFGFVGEGPTNTKPLLLAGAGVRLYTMSDAALKIFIEPSLGLELEKGAGNVRWAADEDGDELVYKQDLVVHLSAGPQIDLSPGVGLYGAAGLTVGMLRALHAWMELEAGVQARFP